MSQPLVTPLHASHAEASGRMTVFAGWRLPVHYGSILAEARAVREAAGMFDVSHMGRLRVRGRDAADVLQRLGTNDLGKIGPGRAQYTTWCTPDGGTIDDLIVWWTGPPAQRASEDDDFVVVVNASRREDDLAHLREHCDGRDVLVVDETQSTAMIAVQGPEAVAQVEVQGAQDLHDLRRFAVMRTVLDEVGATVARTGYTGEDGVEIVCEAGAGPRVWEALRAAGVRPCGLGARDALRMEMGYPLYGHELGLDVSPLEAGVGFAVALGKAEFVGRDALVKQASDGAARTLVGFVCSRPCVPAPGDLVHGDGWDGTVTSGGTSVVLERPIGLAFVPGAVRTPAPAVLRNRGRDIEVELRPLPLIDRRRPPARPAQAAT